MPPFVPDGSPPFSAPFMPDVPPPPFSIPPPPPDGCCCVVAPPPPLSIPPPVPCAFAKPVPAIRAAAATEIKNRLVIERLLTCLHCPRRQRKKMSDVPNDPGVPSSLFGQHAMNRLTGKSTEAR